MKHGAAELKKLLIRSGKCRLMRNGDNWSSPLEKGKLSGKVSTSVQTKLVGIQCTKRAYEEGRASTIKIFISYFGS